MGDQDQDQDDSICMICQDEWTIGSDHQISCLKCGHLFGKSCIEKWIATQGSAAKCPICNKPAKKSEVRPHWCKATKVIDESELSSLRKLLENERTLRKADSAVIFHQNLKLDMLHSEMEKLKRGIIDRDAKIERMEAAILRYNKHVSGQTTADDAESIICNQGDESIDQIVVKPREIKGLFHFAEKVESSPTGGCRAFAICPTASMLLVAQPSPTVSGANIFGAYGLRKFSVIDTNIREFIPLHSKDITSIKLKPIGDLILTASQDKRVKITSISNNISIQSYQSQFEPTCVSWSAHRDQQFYVGTSNCYVYLYDMRNTQEYIYQTDRVASTRVMSITATTGENLHGLLFNDIRGCQFLEISESSDYDQESIDRSLGHLTSHQLPFAGTMGTVDFCKRLDLSLISTRRTPQHPNMSHSLIKLSKLENQEDGSSAIECKNIRTFFSNGPGELLSQSRILKHPTLDDHVLVGATDPASRGIKLWDSSDNTEYQTIKESAFMRDLLMYSPENTNQHILYTLSEKGLNVYRWDFA